MPKQKETNSTKRKRKYLRFEEWYGIAQKYYKEHGNLLVPQNYVDEEGHKLGRWVERQRAFYNGNPKVKVTITQTGIEMLNKIGMVWKLEDRFTWQEWALQCKLYYAANGDLLVPRAYKNGKYALGNWIGEQRKAYKKGTLSEEKEAELNQYGMVWEVVDRNIWEKRYNDAYSYFKEHGNLDVPASMQTVGKVCLRDWLITQKSIYREENCKTDLEWERHDLLDSIGMKWERVNGKILYSYVSLAKKYYEEHGDLRVPKDYKDPTGVDLYSWVKRQWVRYHRSAKGRCKSYHVKKKELEQIGLDWNCEGRWDWDSKEMNWLQNYKKVKSYVEEFKKLPTGAGAMPLASVVSSEFWIDAQRAAIRNGIMNKDKQKMLASIGILCRQQKANAEQAPCSVAKKSKQQ